MYDFAADDDYGNPAQRAVLVGVEGEKLGIAKPFLVLGSASGVGMDWSQVNRG